ncbi:MAG: hypothetical protein Q8R36_01560 [bacterium]|nr:hypothetical protein [bacterium]
MAVARNLKNLNYNSELRNFNFFFDDTLFEKQKERAEFPRTRSVELPNYFFEISDADLGDDFVAVAIVLSQNPTFSLVSRQVLIVIVDRNRCGHK